MTFLITSVTKRSGKLSMLQIYRNGKVNTFGASGKNTKNQIAMSLKKETSPVQSPLKRKYQ
jgi:hypothetical protein